MAKFTRGIVTTPQQLEWTANNIRAAFVDHFKHHGYEHLPSSSVKPDGDASLLFVNAGMNQFKPLFLGTSHGSGSYSDLKKAVTHQKCIRVGGKHNDLSVVGHDRTHHTFFEMLGHWSFRGSVPRAEACRQALELLTDVYRLKRENLLFTFLETAPDSPFPTDEHAKQLWLELGISADCILPGSLEENFWEMGPTGPCGPCTEIHYCDPSSTNAAAPVEIWNIVSITKNRLPDGHIQELPEQHIDTGLGLERLCKILQKTDSNYETDLFSPIMAKTQSLLSWLPSYRDNFGVLDSDRIDRAYRIVSDHARAIAIAVGDGVLPDHRGAGHILKSLVSRSVYHLMKMGGHPDSLVAIVETAAETLSQAYPDLEQKLPDILSVVGERAERSKHSFQRGRRTLKKWLGRVQRGRLDSLSVEDLVKLELSYGVPHELVMDLIGDVGLDCSDAELHRAVAEAKIANR